MTTQTLLNAAMGNSSPLNPTPQLTNSAIKGLSDPITTPSSSSVIPISSLLLDPGNTLNTAWDLGLITEAHKINQFVGNSDPVDFYRLTISNSNLNVSLTGLSADADLRVIRDFNQNGTIDAGEIIASSTRGSNRDESIALSGLASGEYFIQVYQYSGDTNYTLRASYYQPSTLLAIENEVGALSGTKIFSGNISNLNTSDFYRFNVTNKVINNVSTPTQVNITLSGMSNNADADILLIQDTNGNGFIDGNEFFGATFFAPKGAKEINRTLQTGTYFIEVGQRSGSTDYHLGISTGDWFSNTLSDAGLTGEARYLYFSDNQLSRNDVIALLRAAQDDNTIDATELSDLKAIVQNASNFSMPDYVRVLANKVVNGDPANTRAGIGNLVAGSSADQMEKLIGKWFLGTDRPIAISYDCTQTYTYQVVNGALFQNGASYTDVRQGNVNDGYFLSALAAAARQSPNTLTNMFIDNGDNTFTVRFFNQGVADYVTVDRYLPTDAAGNAVFAGWGGGTYANANNELWAALAEKAYAQVNQSGWIGQGNTNSYNGTTTSSLAISNNKSGINGGNTVDALSQISQQATTQLIYKLTTPYGESYNTNFLLNDFNGGELVTVNLYNTRLLNPSLVSNQSYALVGYNSTTKLFRLYNPLGGGEIELSAEQLFQYNADWSSAFPA